jgi:hypothetical protein
MRPVTWAGLVVKNLLRRKARTALSVAGVAIGVGLFVALLHRGATAALAAKPARLELPPPRPLPELRLYCRTGVAVSRVPGPWLGGRGPPAFAG